MTDTDSERIDHYLFGVMSDTERESFEDLMMADDKLFYAVAERENDLVDRFVANSLSRDLADRFESSLSGFPARRQKVANASLLQAHIAKSRQADKEQTYEALSWFQRLGFAFRAPAFAAGALALLMLAAIGFLLVRNGNLQREVAGLKAAQTGDANVSELQKREAELVSILESEKSLSSDLTSDLETERERREKLETELADLRKQISNSRPPVTDTPIAPTIATLVLRPGGGRGEPTLVRKLALSGNEKKVSIVASLPGGATKTATANVELNGSRVANGLRVVTDSEGRRSVSFSTSPDKFLDGSNRLILTDADGNKLGEYVIMRSSK